MANINDYKPGNPEYDYWNDKNLYPSLKHEEDNIISQSQNSDTNLDDTRLSGGTVFLVTFVWLLIFAPFALFSTWENWLVQVVFWGGVVVVMLVFTAWFYEVIKEERESKNPPEVPVDDPNLPWYKKYPPADVIRDREKK